MYVYTTAAKGFFLKKRRKKGTTTTQNRRNAWRNGLHTRMCVHATEQQ